MNQVNPSLRRVSMIKTLPWGTRIGFPTKIPKRSRCATCGKQHFSKCLVGTDGCFGHGNRGHKMRGCPNLKAKGKEVNQDPYDGPDANAPKRNCLFPLR